MNERLTGLIAAQAEALVEEKAKTATLTRQLKLQEHAIENIYNRLDAVQRQLIAGADADKTDDGY